MSVTSVAFRNLTSADFDRWRELEEHSLEPNIYLSLDYVRTLYRHTSLLPELRVLIVTQRTTKNDRFAAILPVIPAAPTRDFPLWHLAAIRSPYTLTSGILLDRRAPNLAAERLFRYLRQVRWHNFGLRMHNLVVDSDQTAILMSAARRNGCVWREDGRTSRACLFGMDRPGRDWPSGIPRRRRKTIDRRKKQLTRTGQLEWRLVEPLDIDDSQITRFLELEHAGWKGDQGSSIRANPEHEDFFVELVDTLRSERRVFLTELSLDGDAIAITVNFRLADHAFAFKTGWHPNYACFGIGILNEVGFLEHIDANRGWGLSRMDSGAEPGTYMDALWPDRINLLRGIFVTNAVGRALIYPMRVYRHLKAVSG